MFGHHNHRRPRRRPRRCHHHHHHRRRHHHRHHHRRHRRLPPTCLALSCARSCPSCSCPGHLSPLGWSPLSSFLAIRSPNGERAVHRSS